MKITLESDYAIRIVMRLAQQENRMDAGTLSQETGVPQRFALKILRKLVNADLLRSFKGISGGYQLNHPAHEISLADIIEVIEGPFAFSRCLTQDDCCSHPDGGCSKAECKVQQVFGDISLLVHQNLKATTVDTLL